MRWNLERLPWNGRQQAGQVQIYPPSSLLLIVPTFMLWMTIPFYQLCLPSLLSSPPVQFLVFDYGHHVSTELHGQLKISKVL